MQAEDRIDMELLKLIADALSEAKHMERMAGHISQVMTGALSIKGSSIFALNPETDELEVLGSFGLSLPYLNKGPVMAERGLACRIGEAAIVIPDVSRSDRLQYPEEAAREGIAAIVSIPVQFNRRLIGCLRLYDHAVWEVTDRDLEALHRVADIIGLAMMVSRLLTALRAVKETVDGVHAVWLEGV